MKIGRSLIPRIILGVCCFVLAYIELLRTSTPFRRHFIDFIGSKFGWRLLGAVPGSPNIPLFACVAAFIAFSLLFWLNADALKAKRLHRFNYALLLLTAAALVIAAVILLYSYPSALTMLALPAVTAGAGIGLWATTVVRAANRWAAKFYWNRFFKAYALKTPLGAVMALLLLANTLVLAGAIAGAPLWFALLPLVIFAAARFICQFIENLSEQYRQANESQLKSERFKAQLITNVSHDIRTPLTSIINYVDLMRQLPIQDAKMDEYLTILEKKGARLKVLISDLLEAAKASTGNVPMNIQTIDLLELLGQVAGEFDGAFTGKGLTYLSRCPEGPVWVAADGKYLWRVLENLFGNALKYSLPNTRVYADISARDRAVLSLKNISSAPLGVPSDWLMEQFIQGERSRAADGNGLGLYIAQSLLELMNGRLEIAVTGDLFEAVISLPTGGKI
ncbi:MAG: HAMP domain-containing histidine kinase [Peptococcaceae bacterium]|jgi:signal transduction histidine kinase|nr:HAMP domain-containing histidine kinase [Peptococcaceae bacterium]